MTLTRTQLIVIAAAGSAFVLLGAFGFQHLGGMAPCKLCLWQRYPHAAAVIIGGLALWLGGRILLYLGAIAALTTAAIGAYHTGVERKWWEGPTSCTGGDIGGLSADELFNQIMSAPVVRCDEIPWQIMGLSMANLNAVGSLVLAAIWLWAATKRA